MAPVPSSRIRRPRPWRSTQFARCSDLPVFPEIEERSDRLAQKRFEASRLEFCDGIDDKRYLLKGTDVNNLDALLVAQYRRGRKMKRNQLQLLFERRAAERSLRDEES